MNYSEMFQLVDEFNAHEPTELVMQYRYWEDDPGKRMLIMPADSASDKFMVKDKGIYARYVYSNDHTFFISAAFAGMAGLIYASYVSYIDPTSFTFDESIFIITALFIGGIGSRVWGPVVGAAVVVILPELLRFIGLPDAVAANLRQVIYGLILIVLMFVRPQGILGDAKLK